MDYSHPYLGLTGTLALSEVRGGDRHGMIVCTWFRGEETGRYLAVMVLADNGRHYTGELDKFTPDDPAEARRRLSAVGTWGSDLPPTEVVRAVLHSSEVARLGGYYTPASEEIARLLARCLVRDAAAPKES